MNHYTQGKFCWYIIIDLTSSFICSVRLECVLNYVQKLVSINKTCHHINSNSSGTFRKKSLKKIVMTVKEKHQMDLSKELEARRLVEQELREKMNEIEVKRWGKVNVN